MTTEATGTTEALAATDTVGPAETETPSATEATATKGVPSDGPSFGIPALPGWTRMGASIVGAFIVFALLLVANGTSPIDAYRAMWDSVARDANSFGDVLVRLTPYLLAALAVAIPARAGMFNIGGEGQLLIGAVGAMATANALGQAIPRGPTLVLMAAAAMIAAGLWAGLAAALRLFTSTT